MDAVALPLNPAAAAPAFPSGLASASYADAAAARAAVEMTLPMIEAALTDREVSGCGFLCIVVMNPVLGPQQAAFDAAVLVEHPVGDPAQWDADYSAYARAKARLSWETGLSGSVVQALRPHMLRDGDSLLWGAVCMDGIVVGVSGALPWFDEAFATAVAANLRALAKRSHARALQAGHTAAGSTTRPA